MPYLRIVTVQADFHSAAEASQVINSAITVFAQLQDGSGGAGAGAVQQPPKPLAIPDVPSPAAAPELPAQPRPAKAAARRIVTAAKPAAAPAPAAAGSGSSDRPLSVAAAIRQVLHGAGAMHIDTLLKRVSPLIAPRVTNNAAVGSIAAQEVKAGRLRRVGEGTYAEA